MILAATGKIRRLLCALAFVAWVSSSQSQIPVVPDWSADQAGNTGFFDPSGSPVAGYGSRGELRRAVFTAAANYVGSLFTPAYAGEVIHVRTSFMNLGTGFIALGGSLGYVNNFGSTNPRYQPDTDYAQALANHLAGQDVAPGNTIELMINSNASIAFNYSTNTTPAQGTGIESMFVAMVHEMVHGLGFVNEINQFTGAYTGFPTAYDQFLVQGATSPVTLTGMSDASRAAAIKSNNLYWNGALATTANGGARVKLYAPATYEAASSVYHLDTTTFDSAGLVMLPSGSPIAPSQLALVALERAMLYDMGWTPSRPRIVSTTRIASTTTLSFTGLLHGNYRLRYTGSLVSGTKVTDWTALSDSVIAGWGTAVLSHSTADAAGFYAVEIVP